MVEYYEVFKNKEKEINVEDIEKFYLILKNTDDGENYSSILTWVEEILKK